MTQPQTDIPVRAPAKTSADDTVQPFDVSALDLRGRVVVDRRSGPNIGVDIRYSHEDANPAIHSLGHFDLVCVEHDRLGPLVSERGPNGGRWALTLQNLASERKRHELALARTRRQRWCIPAVMTEFMTS